MAAELSAGDILLLGATGQVGTSLNRSLSHMESIVVPDRAQADLSKPDALREMVRRHAPRVIVNAAAYTAVDKAETEAARAMAINATAPAILAEEAERLGACLVHYSTDYVYDGRKTEPYVERDPVNPLSVYGRSKLSGDEAVQQICRRHLILRTSWVYSASGNNFLRTILRLAGERHALRIVDDQIGSPTSSELIAGCTAHVLREMRQNSKDDSRWGTYHLTADGAVSWNGYAKFIIASASNMGAKLKAAPERVAAITSAQYPTNAVRPLNSSLDTSKLRSAFPALVLPQWTEGVESTLAALIKGDRGAQ